MKINMFRTASLSVSLAQGAFQSLSLLPLGGGGKVELEGHSLGREVVSSCPNLGRIQEKSQGQGLNKESGLALFTRLAGSATPSFKDPDPETREPR